MKVTKIDITIMLIVPIVAYIVVVSLKKDLLLLSSLLFFGLPALYISLRNVGLVWKSFLFALLFSIPMSIFVDTLSALNGSYVIPKTIFPFKILGISTLELYIFSFLWVFFSVLFYEHFFDHGKKGDRISKHIKGFLYFVGILCSTVVFLFYTNKAWLYIPYFYLILGILFLLLPLAGFLLYYPKFIPRFVVISLYFFYFLMIYEMAALKTHEWFFVGEYVGYVTISGYSFPLEELLIWMIVATPALLAYYEYFADDRKLGAGRNK